MSNDIKKPIKEKPMTLKEIKSILELMKSQKVASFSYKGLAVNFHPMALLQEPKTKTSKQEKAEIKTQEQDDEAFLFDAVE